MSFFDSDLVRSEMAEISELQEEIYKNVFKFPSMNKEEKIYHVDTLQKLLDKQMVLYTRLSLSEDPEAKMMKERIMSSAAMMGLSPNTDMNTIFNSMSKLLDAMRVQIDKTGSDLQNNEVHKSQIRTNLRKSNVF